MSRGNQHAWGAVANNRKAFEHHADKCEWPEGCDNPSAWYYTTAAGRFSLCGRHCPLKYRTDAIRNRVEAQ